AARRASFSVVVAATVAFAIPANAKGGGWPKCHGADPEGRIAGCSQVIERIAKESRHNKIAAYFNRAGAYQIKGDYDHAVEDFGKALEIDPKSSVILSARGAAYRAKGDLDHALADYDAAIAAKPKDAYAFAGRAGVRHAKGELDAAIADYTQAITLNKRLGAAYGGRAAAWRAKGDTEKALEDL